MAAASRCCEFHFVNLTSATFYRHLHMLHHGTWQRQPIEAIHSRQEMVCLAEANRSLGSFSGKIQYAMVLAGVEYIICSEFEIPVLGDSKHVSAMGCNVDARAQGLPEAKTLFDLSFSSGASAFSSFIVTVRETPEGSEYLQKCRDEVSSYIESLKKLESKNIKDIYNTSPPPPQHYLFNVCNIDWRRRLRKAHRSLYIRIINLTAFTFFLDSKKFAALPLEEGTWVEFPSEEIPPLCSSEFGCQSDGFLLGTGGSCTYLVDKQQGHLLFVWDQPGMGGCRSLGVHSKKTFKVYIHLENLNEGSLIFHVLDPANPPLIQLEEARCLSPQSRSVWGAKHNSNLSLSAAEAKEAARFGVDVLSPLLVYLNKKEENNKLHHRTPKMRSSKHNNPTTAAAAAAPAPAAATAATTAAAATQQQQPSSLLPYRRKQIQLTSPRAFFCSLQGLKGFRGVCSPHFYLLLVWRIGSERFFRVFLPDEKIELNSWSVSGLLHADSADVLINAQVINLRRLPPGVHMNSMSFASSGGDPEGLDSGLSEGLDGEGLLLVFIEACRLCCCALQQHIESCMQSLLGSDFLSISKLPEANIWPQGRVDGEKEVIDLEGILHLVTAYWNEVFEQIVRDPQLLQRLQRTVICWASQDLSRFDRAYICEFLGDAAAFCRAFGVEEAAAQLEEMRCRVSPPGGGIDVFSNPKP